MFIQALEGFVYLEAAGILHRDIRPGNLMVTHDGTVKIIDLGFGKQVNGSIDFDKSIDLNWWCETPEEFHAQKYDFGTEVYFVGKLFEKRTHENCISHFNQKEVLRKMCLRNHESRYSSFSATIRELRSDRFPQIVFTTEEKIAYRNFADAICEHVTKAEIGLKYVDDFSKISIQLNDVYQKVLLEDVVPDSLLVTQCFLDGIYYYKKKGFMVHVLADFIAFTRTCTVEKIHTLLANLHTRFDTIPRYEKEIPDGAPF